MNTDTFSEIVHLLVTIILPGVTIIIVLILWKELKVVLKRLSSAEELRTSIGSLSIEAKAIKELQRSVHIGLPGDMIRKTEVEALIDTKLRSIRSLIEYHSAGLDARALPRIVDSIKVKITNGAGEVFMGETVDVSSAGIGFKSDAKLRFNEIVEVAPADPQHPLTYFTFDKVRIVRIKESKEEYHYGAAITAGFRP